YFVFFFFQAEDGIRDRTVTGVQTCALPIYLIEHAELLGMTPVEQIIVANVARYHRGAEPKKKHRNYGGLERSVRQTIKRLSAIRSEERRVGKECRSWWRTDQ